jgi:hypothetical protein
MLGTSALIFKETGPVVCFCSCACVYRHDVNSQIQYNEVVEFKIVGTLPASITYNIHLCIQNSSMTLAAYIWLLLLYRLLWTTVGIKNAMVWIRIRSDPHEKT